MATIIDTIRVTDRLRRHVPALDVPFPGEGLLVILDSRGTEPPDLSGAAGQAATVTRPDGSRLECVIAGVDVRSGVGALYFEGLAEADVPRLSRVSWEGRHPAGGLTSP